MFDLDEFKSVADYTFTFDGETRTYDGVLIWHKLEGTSKEKDPAKVQETIKRLFDLDVKPLQALALMEDFYKWSEETLDGPIKKVFGKGLFSTTTSDSDSESTENSAP